MCRCNLVDLMNFWASSEYELLICTHCFIIFLLYFQKQLIWQITLCLDIFSSCILFYIQQHIIFYSAFCHTFSTLLSLMYDWVMAKVGWQSFQCLRFMIYYFLPKWNFVKRFIIRHIFPIANKEEIASIASIWWLDELLKKIVYQNMCAWPAQKTPFPFWCLKHSFPIISNPIAIISFSIICIFIYY